MAEVPCPTIAGLPTRPQQSPLRSPSVPTSIGSHHGHRRHLRSLESGRRVPLLKPLVGILEEIVNQTVYGEIPTLRDIWENPCSTDGAARPRKWGIGTRKMGTLFKDRLRESP